MIPPPPPPQQPLGSSAASLGFVQILSGASLPLSLFVWRRDSFNNVASAAQDSGPGAGAADTVLGSARTQQRKRTIKLDPFVSPLQITRIFALLLLFLLFLSRTCSKKHKLTNRRAVVRWLAVLSAVSRYPVPHATHHPVPAGDL